MRFHMQLDKLDKALKKVEQSLHMKREQLEKAELAEQYESVSVCLRAYNDRIFGGLTKTENSVLQQRRVSSITHLILLDIKDWKETHRPLSKTSQTFIATVKKALKFLTPDELELCRDLHEQFEDVSLNRHTQQHPKLDASTRMRKDGDKDDTDRSLLAAAGSPNEANTLRTDIAKLQDELRKLQAGVAAPGEDAGHGANPCRDTSSFGIILHTRDARRILGLGVSVLPCLRGPAMDSEQSYALTGKRKLRERGTGIPPLDGLRQEVLRSKMTYAWDYLHNMPYIQLLPLATILRPRRWVHAHNDRRWDRGILWLG
ncbi:hypothetical protein GGX14DRAFT_391444 [Mycena pura]|uniref:Uncharacterized protein n=1 Tax=Mycena pura TaxID=153505 RepID=A0AAD6VQS1_9AGAR|nr:hypothetical protein GGX14DRAFT_391444 [Mycena pura]